MKKIISVLLILILMSTLLACGGNIVEFESSEANESITENKIEDVLNESTFYENNAKEMFDNDSVITNFSNNTVTLPNKNSEKDITSIPIESHEKNKPVKNVENNIENEIIIENNNKNIDNTLVKKVSYYKYTTCSLNVRNYPDITGKKITTFPINTKVHVIEECENKWVKIEYKDSFAFVKSTYLSNEKTTLLTPQPTNTPIPTPVPTPEPTATPTPEPTATPTPEPTNTPTPTPETVVSTSESNNTITVEVEGTYNYELAKEAFDLVNQKRIDSGLPALVWDDTLYETAKIRAAEASIFWSHTRPDGTHWSILSKRVHGENLAKNYNSPSSTIEAWMQSEGHKANMLRSNFTRGAIAYFETSNGCFYCQHFGY